MSNRVLWFLIILIFILSSIAFFMYAFLYNDAKIVINSNISEYYAEIYNKKTLKKYDFECNNKKCFLEDIPPFTYKLTITKKWYKQIIQEVSLPRNKTINIDIVLNKKIKLEEIIEEPKKVEVIEEQEKLEVIEEQKKVEISKNNSEKKINSKEKIQKLIARKNKIKNILQRINNKKNLDKTKNKKYLFLNKINLFKNSDFSKITVLETFWDKNIFFLKFQEKKYIYNKKSSNIDEIKLKIPVIYLKKSWNSEIDLVTGKWIFTYSLNNKRLKYFSLFQDYINYKWNYIWVISNQDNTRKNNFWFSGKNKNLIILCNKKDFTKKIIFETDKDIKKIINNNDEIIIYNSDNKKFKLSNFE